MQRRPKIWLLILGFAAVAGLAWGMDARGGSGGRGYSGGGGRGYSGGGGRAGYTSRSGYRGNMGGGAIQQRSWKSNGPTRTWNSKDSSHGGSWYGNPHGRADWHDIDPRYLHDDGYRRSLYYRSFYRYYPYPYYDSYTYVVPSAPPVPYVRSDSGADYSVVPGPVTRLESGPDTSSGEDETNVPSEAARSQDGREWIPGHYEEVPVEDVIPDQTVEVYHPAVYRHKEDGSLEKVADESVSREPKIRILLTRRWIEGHYADEEDGDQGPPNGPMDDQRETTRGLTGKAPPLALPQ